ncbi:MAG: DUF349 domain-containing protein [Bacteroidales bacterium]|nr:DUF349 domain-containing protein [Bacteroidales bacterium]MCL2738305.1 DUF349 domain-containing protein [Bacteroidales bacterium]
MDQEKTMPAPEEQFDEQQPVETNLTPSPEQQTVEPKIEKQSYANLSLPEILLEFDRLLNLGDYVELQRNAELLRSCFYKGLCRERGEEPVPEALSFASDGQTELVPEESEETESKEAITEAQDEPLLYVEEENAFKRMYARFRAMRGEFVKQQELQKEHNLRVKQTIIEELKVLVEKQEDPNHTFPEFRVLQTRWKEVGPVPIANTKDIWDTYQHYVEKFYDYVKINNEFRDLDFKKNLEQKILLCEKAEELLLESSIVSAFHKLQKLHEEWRESGPVAREHREQVWDRFKATTASINKKYQEFFEEQKKVQKKNLEEKTILCEKAEELTAVETNEANEWNRRSRELEKLQKMWKSIGFASKKDNQKIYDRFKAASNAFHNAKRQYYSQFKHNMQDNYERKMALCEQAEALQDSEEWRKTSDLLINLQRQWKEVGPVARKQSDKIWKRFRSACDKFFENKAKHFNEIDENFDDNLKKKEALIQEIHSYQPSGNNNENLSMLKDFQRRWTEIGFVPIKEKEKLQTAYRQALDLHFGALRANEGDRGLGKFKKRIEDMQGGGKSDRAFRSEREKLLHKFRQMESDIALWENNMGFFAKSRNAESMIADMERKIVQAKEELRLVEEKIKLMDKQLD